MNFRARQTMIMDSLKTKAESKGFTFLTDYQFSNVGIFEVCDSNGKTVLQSEFNFQSNTLTICMNKGDKELPKGFCNSNPCDFKTYMDNESKYEIFIHKYGEFLVPTKAQVNN